MIWRHLEWAVLIGFCCLLAWCGAMIYDDCRRNPASCGMTTENGNV